MSIWTNALSFLGWGTSTRTSGQQVGAPSSGKLTKRTVNADTAMQIGAVFASCRLLAESVAGLPLEFFEVQAGGALKQVFEHPLLQLLTKKPNRYQTNIEFFETLMWQYALNGNAYHRIDRTSKGRIVSLMPYMSPQVKVDLNDAGDVAYIYSTGKGVAAFASKNIWHNKLFGNGVIGLSPLEYARNSMGVQISAEDRVNKIANNNFKQSGVLMIDKVLTEKQRKAIRENFSDLVEGGDDALKVLEAGATYTPTSMNPKDAQFLETRRFGIEDIGRFFNVPSVLINDTSATTVWGSGIEQIINGFYKLGLRPYVERIESSISNNLLIPSENGKIIPVFDFDQLLRGDEGKRYTAYKTAIGSGVKTINECRKKEGLVNMPGGEVLRIQQQVVPLAATKGETT